MNQIIPLTSTPNQTVNVTVSVNGQNSPLQIGLRFNEYAGYWVMSITNRNTQTMLIDSLPLISGDYPAGNLLGQYDYLGIGSAAIINAGNAPMDYPDSTNLGTDFLLVWGDTV